jgi:hypothetical protein
MVEEENLCRHMEGQLMNTTTCLECDRVFDLTNLTDSSEWHYGHDCETNNQHDDANETSLCRNRDQQVTVNHIEEISDTIYEVLKELSSGTSFSKKPLDAGRFLSNLDFYLWECHRLYLGDAQNTPTIKAILKVARKLKKEMA